MSNQIAQGWVQYDEEIIRAGQEACQQIGIRFRLSRVSWRKWSAVSAS
jgi:hypothetical protein